MVQKIYLIRIMADLHEETPFTEGISDTTSPIQRESELNDSTEIIKSQFPKANTSNLFF